MRTHRNFLGKWQRKKWADMIAMTWVLFTSKAIEGLPELPVMSTWSHQIIKDPTKETLESSWDSKEIKPGNLKGSQPWILIGRTDAKTSVFWSSDANSWLIGKVPDAGKDWGQKEKRASEWDGLMSPLMQWTWIWANFRRWWGTGRPSMLQSMG